MRLVGGAAAETHMAAAGELAMLDVETLALMAGGPEATQVAVCGKLETFKEIVRPLKQTDTAQRAALLAERR